MEGCAQGPDWSFLGPTAEDPVAADLGRVDWAGTPLGPPRSWSRSLRTTVRTMLGSRFSMWLAWGPELTFFCNDAYRRGTLGKKYPWALGRPAAAVWTEIWTDIGPRIDHVLATGVATWDEGLFLFLGRSGYPEETYHTFSYSPLADDDDAIVGMLCVVSEDTERVVAERRMATLRLLAAAGTAAATEKETLDAACVQLGANPRDLPFTLIYLREDTPPTGAGPGGAAGGPVARLACATGGIQDHPAAPAGITPGQPGAPWPLSTETVLLDLDESLELPAGVWPAAPVQALVVPLKQPAGGDPYGWLIAGVNRYRPLDEDYRGFVHLIAGQLSAGIGAARAFEVERARAESLTELDAAKTAFFTNVSHELRTPLTLILGPVQDLLTAPRSSLSAADRATLHLAAGNATRLLHLVNTLLDFARTSDGRARPVFRQVDITRFTCELVAMFTEVIARAGLRLTCRLEPVAAPVWVDTDAWTKIVSNLLSNALKHTFTGSITVELRQVTDAGAAAVVELVVSDTGTGIAAAQLPRLFDRFHRVPRARARSHEGSGIGLALTAELVALHGGRIEVASTLAAGATFTVRIPTGRDHLPEQDTDTDGQPADPSAAGGFLAEMDRWLPSAGPGAMQCHDHAGHGHPDGQAASGGVPADASRVLVVDDNADMRAYLATLLTEHYRVSTAADGAEALAAARDQVPDLVLTDVMMPVLDGFGLLAALRADPATAGIPVVMLTARAGAEGIADGLEAGADDYLSKPFSARELFARVRANLELDRSRRIRAELERSRDLLDRAQRLARLGSWELDLTTGAVRFSAQLCRMLELDPAHDLMTRQAAFAFLHPDDVDLVEQALAEGIAGTGAVSYEARFRTTAGREVLSEILGEVERDPHGTAVLIRGSVQDITAARHLAQQQRQAAIQVAVLAETADREHRIADELQAALLPPARFDSAHLQVLGYYRAGVAGTRVGGDWYDVIDLGAGRTALTVGDVMGRGVRAAALMGQVRSVVRTLAHLHLPPAELLARADELVRDIAPQACLVTCLYAVHDPTTGRISFANAGHMPPLLAHADGAVQVLEVPAATPLGTGRCDPAEHHVPISTGDTLALYTDGLVERRGRPLEPAIARLGGAISRWTAGQPLHPLVDALLPDGSEDDVALLLARVGTTAATPTADPTRGSAEGDRSG